MTEHWGRRWPHWSRAEIYPAPALTPSPPGCPLGWQVAFRQVAEEALPASDTGHQCGSGCLMGWHPLPRSGRPVCRCRVKHIGQTGGQRFAQSDVCIL